MTDRALSIWPPHGSFLLETPPGAAGPVKLYETRSWPAPAFAIGRRIWIHQSTNMQDILNLEEWRDLLGLLGPRSRWPTGKTPAGMAAQALDLLDRLGYSDMRRDLPRGAIIGSAMLVACHRAERVATLGEPWGDFSRGRWAWEFVDAQLLPAPLAGVKGSMGLWRWDPARPPVKGNAKRGKTAQAGFDFGGAR